MCDMPYKIQSTPHPPSRHTLVFFYYNITVCLILSPPPLPTYQSILTLSGISAVEVSYAAISWSVMCVMYGDVRCVIYGVS